MSHNVVVYVLNISGQPLMPCSPRKARILLKEGKADVVQRTPFTIQLNYECGSDTQLTTLGMDAGYKKVGLSIKTEKRELYADELELRTDIVKLLADRRMFRRTRRGRKTRYRQPRFLNRVKSKHKGWLAPSIQHKLDSHVKAVERIKQLIPITKIIVEVAAFDIQKLKNPDIQGKEYQQGDLYGFYNRREYVLHRDGHQCRHCKGKNKDPILTVLEAHHLVSRKTGGDRPDNLITLCKTCHELHHAGKIKLTAKPKRGFKAEAFMNTVRRKLVKLLGAEATYGYITKLKRQEFGIPKSHTNDAFMIAGGTDQKRCQQYQTKLVRKQNRKLYKGVRSHLRNTAPRFVHGFQRYDKVKYKGIECFIFGRRSRGYFDVRLLDGTKIHTAAKVKKLTLLERATTALQERRGFLPTLKDGVSAAKIG